MTELTTESDWYAVLMGAADFERLLGEVILNVVKLHKHMHQRCDVYCGFHLIQL